MEKRQEVMATIQHMYDSMPLNKRVWSKENVLSLTRFVKLENTLKLRGCYFAAKKDPSVICREEEKLSTKPIETTPTIDDVYAWNPTKLMDKYKRINLTKTYSLIYFTTSRITFHRITGNWSIKMWLHPYTWM